MASLHSVVFVNYSKSGGSGLNETGRLQWNALNDAEPPAPSSHTVIH